VRLETNGDHLALVSRVSGTDLDATNVRLRVDAPEMAAQVDASATPFLPVMTLLAARLGTDLVIDAPVDELALENALRAAAVLHDFWGWRPPRINPAQTTSAVPRANGTALWFSRGVDSMDTLLRARAGELVECGSTVQLTHLLGLDWIDPPFAVSSMPEVWSDTVEAAASLPLPLLRFTTDIRRILDAVVSWDDSHGAVFGGLSLLLGPVFGAVIISATDRADALLPYGSHPSLDPLWSTSGTRVVHAGSERGRCDKVARVARDDWVLARLKVCWEADTARNCGRCSKCLATMTALHIAGALDRCGRFDGELSPDAVLQIARGPNPLPRHRTTVADLLEHLPDDAGDLRAAWTEYQQRLTQQYEATR
jgi:hypothetical protein